MRRFFMGNFKRAFLETGLAAISSTIFFLFATALFAVFVRAYAPEQITITVVNQFIKCFGCFLFSLIFVRSGRALFKGAAAGAAALILSTILFGMIGGFRLTAFFLLEFVLCVLFGALGALFGAKLRKE